MGWSVRLARMGFSPTTVPALAVSPKTEIVKGKPDWAWYSSEPRQSRVTARVRLFLPQAFGLYTALNARRWRISQPGPFSALRSSLFCGVAASNMGDRKSGAFWRALANV